MATYYGRKYRQLELRHRFKELMLATQIALKSKECGRPAMDRPACVAMVDGMAYHGGMCDRFKGIITLYAYCKHHGIPFRIRYTYPFRLEDYLSPAAYDWTLKENEYTDNPLYSKVLYMRGEHLARRLLGLKVTRQVHFYTNRDCLERVNDALRGDDESTRYGWGELFRELFRPGDALRERIDAIKSGLGEEYYAAVFRFQNLLGDFHEYRYRELGSEDEKEALIVKCLDAISELKKRHGGRDILVTSDSATFLKRASQIDGVHIIPGDLVHIDQVSGAGEHGNGPYMKSFLDFYVLSEASKIYRVGTSYMYPSEFPVYAAKVHGIPFESIEI